MIRYFKEEKSFILFFLAVWVILFSLIILLDNFFHFLPWGETYLYDSLASKVLDGQIPYIDFYFEYPPASIFIFLLPKILSNKFITYQFSFSIVNLILSFFTAWLGSKICEIIKKGTFKKFFLLQSILFLMLIQLVLTRYDVSSMFFTALGVYLYIKGDSTSNSTFKAFGYVSVLIGGFVKMYPIFILPIFAIKELLQKRYKDLVVNIILCAAVSLPFAILLILGREGVSWFIDYHGSRGLEIESTYSSFFLFLNQIGLFKDVEIVYKYASYGIEGTLPNLIAKYSLPVFLLFYFVILYLVFKSNWKKKPFEKIVNLSISVILLFVLTNKVFSTQYILWFFPLLLILVFTYSAKLKKRLILFLMFSSAILTILIYPVFWETFNKGNLILTLILLIRNIFLIGMFCKSWDTYYAL